MRRALVRAVAALAFAVLPACAAWHALDLRDAPPGVRTARNPYDGDPDAVLAGAKLVHRHCLHCHGSAARERGAPSLASARVRSAPAGELFWFITNGSLRDGMPSWSRLPEAQRWQIVTYLRARDAVR